MRFVIEALGLTSGGGKAGLLRLLPALADRGRHHTFVAVLADLEEFRALERPNLRLLMQPKPASLVRRHFHLQRAVPRICAQERADALLCLGNFGPLRPALPAVVLLHNAHYVSNGAVAEVPPTLRERLIAGYARRYLRRLPERVQLVVQTEMMKQRVIADHGVPASTVTVICDGVGLPPEVHTTRQHFKHDLSAPSSLPLGEGATPVAGEGSKRSDPEAPFTFLCVARYYPHKNLEVLPKAMKRLQAYSSRPVRCLVTIHSDQHSGAGNLLRKIESQGLEDAVVNLGQLDGNEVVQAYRSADAFILPSLLESFGRTYLEAIRFNLPILTSDRDFAHELCRGAALYFDPLDAASVAQGMARIMADSVLRDQLAAERQHILIPSWDDIGARFLEVLERAVAAHEPCGSSSLALGSC